MTQKEFISKVAEFCGQRVNWRKEGKYIETPIIMKAEKGWERNKAVEFGAKNYPPYTWPERNLAIVDIYVPDTDRWFIITYEGDKFYLQENHADGDITYFVDGAKSIRAIYSAIRKEIPQAINI